MAGLYHAAGQLRNKFLLHAVKAAVAHEHHAVAAAGRIFQGGDQPAGCGGGGG